MTFTSAWVPAAPPLTLVTFLSLGLALGLGLWRRRAALPPALLALACALAAGHLSWAGALWLSIGAGLAVARMRGSELQRGLSTMGLALLVLPMGLHLLPGFQNHEVYSGPLSAQSPTFTLTWNLDKACAGFLMLVGVSAPRQEGRPRLWIGAALALGAVLLIAASAGSFAWDPKLPRLWPAWLLANLCFVSIPEEALFRMTLQPALEQALGSSWAAIGITSLFFGLVHLSGGWTFGLLATFAGLAYGCAYQVRQVPWHPVAVHLGLNLVHFLCFAYPVR